MQFINPLAMGLMEPIENTILEQGAGLLRVDAAIQAMRTMGLHVSTYPAELNLTDCPYMWPYCEQVSLFYLPLRFMRVLLTI